MTWNIKDFFRRLNEVGSSLDMLIGFGIIFLTYYLTIMFCSIVFIISLMSFVITFNLQGDLICFILFAILTQCIIFGSTGIIRKMNAIRYMMHSGNICDSFSAMDYLGYLIWVIDCVFFYRLYLS